LHLQFPSEVVDPDEKATALRAVKKSFLEKK